MSTDAVVDMTAFRATKLKLDVDVVLHDRFGRVVMAWHPNGEGYVLRGLEDAEAMATEMRNDRWSVTA